MGNTVFLYKSNKFYTNKRNLFFRIINSSIETFRREKSARNNYVSSTRLSFGTLGPKLSHGTSTEVR